MNGTMANGREFFFLPWYEIKFKAKSGIALILWADQVYHCTLANQCDGQFGMACFKKNPFKINLDFEICYKNV